MFRGTDGDTVYFCWLWLPLHDIYGVGASQGEMQEGKLAPILMERIFPSPCEAEKKE